MSPRASSSAIVSALIMPRSATMQTRLMRKRRRRRCFPATSLSACRPAVAVDEHSQDHLIEIGPMVLGEAAPSESLAARALEIEARGVHEHDVERGEQIPPAGEQLFLQNVLHAARRKRRGGILLIFGKLLAEPRHGAVEMMELEPADRFDAIVLAPAVGGAVR